VCTRVWYVTVWLSTGGGGGGAIGAPCKGWYAYSGPHPPTLPRTHSNSNSNRQLAALWLTRFCAGEVAAEGGMGGWRPAHALTPLGQAHTPGDLT
jgi:hypothetical protein